MEMVIAQYITKTHVHAFEFKLELELELGLEFELEHSLVAIESDSCFSLADAIKVASKRRALNRAGGGSPSVVTIVTPRINFLVWLALEMFFASRRVSTLSELPVDVQILIDIIASTIALAARKLVARPSSDVVSITLMSGSALFTYFFFSFSCFV